MLRNNDAKLGDADAWWATLTPEQQASVFRKLMDFAITAEWVDVRSAEARKELAEEGVAEELFTTYEEGERYYAAPYFASCGLPMC